MSKCKDCQHNQGWPTGRWCNTFICYVGRYKKKVPVEYLEKEKNCPDFKKVEE